MGKQPWQRHLLLATMGLVALFLIGGTLVASFQWISDHFPVFLRKFDRGTLLSSRMDRWPGSSGFGPRRRNGRSYEAWQLYDRVKAHRPAFPLPRDPRFADTGLAILGDSIVP
jgi:hypothetical protein